MHFNQISSHSCGICMAKPIQNVNINKMAYEMNSKRENILIFALNWIFSNKFLFYPHSFEVDFCLLAIGWWIDQFLFSIWWINIQIGRLARSMEKSLFEFHQNSKKKLIWTFLLKFFLALFIFYLVSCLFF